MKERTSFQVKVPDEQQAKKKGGSGGDLIQNVALYSWAIGLDCKIIENNQLEAK